MQVRFIVMNNVFQTHLPIHRLYDLKGSTCGRGQGAAEPAGAGTILKDLDLNIQLKLEESWHARCLPPYSCHMRSHEQGYITCRWACPC